MSPYKNLSYRRGFLHAMLIVGLAFLVAIILRSCL